MSSLKRKILLQEIKSILPYQMSKLEKTMFLLYHLHQDYGGTILETQFSLPN